MSDYLRMGKRNDEGHDGDALLKLIADVHTGAPSQEDRLDKALGALESTHRQASAAMQRFERTGRTGLGRAAASAGSLSFAPGPGSEPEPEGHGPPLRAEPTARFVRPQSQEVTQMGPAPAKSLPGPPSAHMPPADDGQQAPRTAHATPQSPAKVAPVAEVLSGRGAEFIARGHTQTHIIRPHKNLPKK